MYNSKSSRKLAWRRGKIVQMPARGRGQWGMGSDAYGRLYFNANSHWFEVDWATYDRQWPSKGSSVRAPTNRVYGIRPNTALNRNYKPGRILEDGRVASVTTISGLAVHSHGAYGKDWEGTIFSMSPGTNSVGAFLPEVPFPRPKSICTRPTPMRSGSSASSSPVPMSASARSMPPWGPTVVRGRFSSRSHPTQAFPHFLPAQPVGRA